MPCGSVAGLPEIDVVVLSHNHYDHLDLPTLRALYAQQGAHVPALLLPLNTARLIDFVPAERVRELDWWEAVRVEAPQGCAEFTATPAQHMTARTPFDTACSLWCSWAVRAADADGDADGHGTNVWFAGDTGYSAVDADDDYTVPGTGAPNGADRPVNPEFGRIGERLGPFDLAFLPIGAYAPRRFLSTVHTAPIDAARIFQDIRAAKAFAIHWGTWDLSHEPVSERPRMLAAARDELGIGADEFETIALGGSVTVEPSARASASASS